LAPATPRPPALGPEGVGRHGLDVAPLRHGDDELLVVDEVLDVDVADVVGDLGPALVGEALPDVSQLVLDDREQAGLVGQDRLELGDGAAQRLELGLEVDAARRVSWPRRMSRMCSAWSIENSNGSAIRPPRRGLRRPG
jgi:hypothetical protein